jgi:hypothetical protein
MRPVCFHQPCKIDPVNRAKGVSTRSDVARRRLLRPAARFENQPSQRYFDRNVESPTDMRGAYALHLEIPYMLGARLPCNVQGFS